MAASQELLPLRRSEHSSDDDDHARDDATSGDERKRRGSGTGAFHDASSDDDSDDGGAMNGREAIVSARNVHKTYLLGVEGVPALRGVTFSVRRGEFIVILGKSGGGKTSMLNIIGTIDKPTKGHIRVCGRQITAKTTDAEFAQLRLRNIGFVFQTFNLISSMSAAENVELPMILDGRKGKAARRRRAAALLDRVGMGMRLDHLPSQLSGGEQQRVTIARAIANHPDLLLLDEPTGDLDSHNSHIILRMLLDLNRREGITCVMVTHDQSHKAYAHRVFHMLDGKLFRVERISQAQRDEAERELRESMSAAKESQRAPVEPEPEIRDPALAYKFSR